MTRWLPSFLLLASSLFMIKTSQSHCLQSWQWDWCCRLIHSHEPVAWRTVSTHPCWDPVLSVMVLKVLLSWFWVTIQMIVLNAELKLKHHLHMRVLCIQVGEGRMESSGDGVWYVVCSTCLTWLILQRVLFTVSGVRHITYSPVREWSSVPVCCMVSQSAQRSQLGTLHFLVSEQILNSARDQIIICWYAYSCVNVAREFQLRHNGMSRCYIITLCNTLALLSLHTEKIKQLGSTNSPTFTESFILEQ